ncbi:MAG: hypothetical protein V2J51_14710 [Erythrobacter sp.]|jgi:hypothetical protein|nr:hypothetical protein [Erythrobacter sp.]
MLQLYLAKTYGSHHDYPGTDIPPPRRIPLLGEWNEPAIRRKGARRAFVPHGSGAIQAKRIGEGSQRTDHDRLSARK